MFFKNLIIKLFSAFILILISLGSYHYLYRSPENKTSQDIADSVKAELAKSFHHNTIWDKNYFKNNVKAFYSLIRFENQQLCPDLKKINTQGMSYQEIIQKFKSKTYTCFKKPLTVSPNPNDKRFLRKDGSITYNLNETNIAHQVVCVSKKGGCVIRIKMDGFPGTIRPQPHSTKAILNDPLGDPSDYNNELFKVTHDGKPVPKGPKKDFGLAPCPYENDKKKCTLWIDELMSAAHPDLKKD